MENKRSATRQRTFKGGSVSTPGGIIECIIRNLSDTGALLEFSAPTALPGTFKLIIKPEIITRTRQA